MLYLLQHCYVTVHSFMADRGMDRMKFMFAELGYFSMIGLLRLHTLMGDYSLALKSVGHIDLSKRVCIFSNISMAMKH